MAPGDVVYASFPFSDGINAKDRPVFVLCECGALDLTICQITSTAGRPNAVPLVASDFVAGGLPRDSFIQPVKISTIQKGDVTRHLGRVTQPKYDQVKAAVVGLMTY